MVGQQTGDSYGEAPVALASNGSFVVERLGSGTYFLRVARRPEAPTKPPTTVGFEVVQVGSEDVSDVIVRIRGETALTGAFRMESDTPVAAWPSEIVVNAYLAFEGTPMLAGVVADGAPEGKFVLRNAFGPRVLRCGYSLPPGPNRSWWPERVLLDGVDITNVPTDFSKHETGRLEVVFTQHPARIVGAVIDAAGQAVRAPWILVMSADPALQEEWATTNHVGQGNTKGRFAIPVTPGRYLVAAVPQTMFRFNPWVDARKAVRRFASGGTAVSVKERDVTNVTLTIR
jgi:hypothetical protein